MPRKDPPLDVRIAEDTAFLRRTALEANVPSVDGDRVLVLQQTVHAGTLVLPLISPTFRAQPLSHSLSYKLKQTNSRV